MSLYRVTGRVSRPPGISGSIIKNVKLLDLRPVEKIEYKFDPFHPNTQHIRKFINHLSAQKVRDTNLNTKFKTDIVCDRSDPEVFVKLNNGKSILFKLANLDLVELLTNFNKIVLPLVPPPETENKQAVQTKQTKSQGQKQIKKKTK